LSHHTLGLDIAQREFQRVKALLKHKVVFLKENSRTA